MCVTCLIHVCGMPHSSILTALVISSCCIYIHIHIHTLLMCVTCLIDVCDAPHSSVMTALVMSREGGLSIETYAYNIYLCDIPHSRVRHASFMCVTCLSHVCGMPHSSILTALLMPWGGGGSIDVRAYSISLCVMPHSCVCHASFMCVSCLIHVCDMPHSSTQMALVMSSGGGVCIDVHTHTIYVCDVSYSCV